MNKERFNSDQYSEQKNKSLNDKKSITSGQVINSTIYNESKNQEKTLLLDIDIYSKEGIEY